MQNLRISPKSSTYDLFSDFERTLVLPEISYKDWVLPRLVQKEKFVAEWEVRRSRVKNEGSSTAQEHYLNLYSKLFTALDFKEISLKYSLNKAFGSWCKRFFKAHDYTSARLTIVTRGLAPVVRHYFERPDTKSALSVLGISLSSVIGSEPVLDRQGVMKVVSSAVFSKRKFVKDGHIMLGDERDEMEFANYPYFVNLSKWMGSGE